MSKDLIIQASARKLNADPKKKQPLLKLYTNIIKIIDKSLLEEEPPSSNRIPTSQLLKNQMESPEHQIGDSPHQVPINVSEVKLDLNNSDPTKIEVIPDPKEITIANIFRHLFNGIQMADDNHLILNNLEIIGKILDFKDEDKWELFKKKFGVANASIKNEKDFKFDVEVNLSLDFWKSKSLTGYEKIHYYFITNSIIQFYESIKKFNKCKSASQENNKLIVHYTTANEIKKQEIVNWFNKKIDTHTGRKTQTDLVIGYSASLKEIFTDAARFYCEHNDIFTISTEDIVNILKIQLFELENRFNGNDQSSEIKESLSGNKNGQDLNQSNSKTVSHLLPYQTDKLMMGLFSKFKSSHDKFSIESEFQKIKIKSSHLIDWMFMIKISNDEKATLCSSLLILINDLFKDLNVTHIDGIFSKTQRSFLAFEVIQEIIESIMIKLDPRSVQASFWSKFVKKESTYLDQILATMNSFILNKLGINITEPHYQAKFKNLSSNFRTLFESFKDIKDKDGLTQWGLFDKGLRTKNTSSPYCIFFINLLGLGYADKSKRTALDYDMKIFFIENLQCVYNQHQNFYVNLSDIIPIYANDGIINCTAKNKEEELLQYNNVNMKILDFMDKCFDEKIMIGDCSITAFRKSLEDNDDNSFGRKVLLLKTLLIQKNEGHDINIINKLPNTDFNFINKDNNIVTLSALPDFAAINLYISNLFSRFNKHFDNFYHIWEYKVIDPITEIKISQDELASLEVIHVIQAKVKIDQTRAEMAIDDPKKVIENPRLMILTQAFAGFFNLFWDPKNESVREKFENFMNKRDFTLVQYNSI